MAKVNLDLKVDLRREVENAVRSACRTNDSVQINRAALIKPFLTRGASRATLYRWADDAILNWLYDPEVIVDPMTGEDPRPFFVVNRDTYATFEDWLAAAVERQKENEELLKRAAKHARLVKNHARSVRLLLAVAKMSREDILTTLALFAPMRSERVVEKYRSDIAEMAAELREDFPYMEIHIKECFEKLVEKWTAEKIDTMVSWQYL